MRGSGRVTRTGKREPVLREAFTRFRPSASLPQYVRVGALPISHRPGPHRAPRSEGTYIVIHLIRHRLLAGTGRRAVLLTLLAILTTIPALGLVVTTGDKAQAHGTPMKPASRTFLCWQDGLTETGEIKPVNPACKAAAQQSGTTPFYNWFSVLRSDGAGRTRGFVPDGELCSGGNTNFTGFNQARNDWPLTHLTEGATIDFSYNAWAAHPGWFYVYITKDGFDPTQTLTWDDMEEAPSSPSTTRR